MRCLSPEIMPTIQSRVIRKIIRIFVRLAFYHFAFEYSSHENMYSPRLLTWNTHEGYVVENGWPCHKTRYRV